MAEVRTSRADLSGTEARSEGGVGGMIRGGRAGGLRDNGGDGQDRMCARAVALLRRTS